MLNRALRPVAMALFVGLLGYVPARAGEPLEYNRDVRPILAENCFACHGADSAARKADLRLDRRADALRADVLVPGHPEKSALVERIFADDPVQLMPPPKTLKKLTPAQKATLRRWIASGAEYEPHWSLIPPRRPPLPLVKSAGWIRTPIDNFILAELEKQGLAPAPEADRHTLARRLSLDLTGLPPEPADVERFVKDRDPNAYEHLVDRLLQSPHWGEHRGRYWLDVARYADTHGIHLDNFREIWSYRDWVIDAFNRNLPFDRFTIEQLAGDLLPNRSTDQLVASGFNRCNITTSEGGAIPEEYLVLYTRDRTETTAAVWLGLTANCAVCHDHKFDPLSQREFYEMSAFFNNTTQDGMDGNIKDTPPVVPLPRPDDRPRWSALTKELADIRKDAEARKRTVRAALDKWLTTASPGQIAAAAPTAGLHFHAPLDEGQGKTLHWYVGGQAHSATLPDGFSWDVGHVAAAAFKINPGAALEAADAGDFDTTQAFSCGGWLRLPNKSGYIGAVLARMDDLQQTRGWELRVDSGRVGVQFFHRWPTSVIKLVCQRLLDARSWHHVFLTYDGSGKAAGIK